MLPSQQLQAWLELQLRKSSPGESLPLGKDLAARFNLSEPTVKRVLRPFVEDGRLIRIRGRGTFVAPLPEGKPPPPPNGSSVENLLHLLRRAIARGDYRLGGHLPSVKYLSIQFGLRPATVISAYHELGRSGLVEKIGKRFWVGGFMQRSARADSPRQVVFLTTGRESFVDVFTRSQLGPAYQRMEIELMRNGFHTKYIGDAEFVPLIQRMRRTGDWPAGIVAHGANQSGLSNTLLPLLPAFKKRNTSILLEWRDAPNKRPPGVESVSVGNLHTTLARTAARFLATKGLHDTVLFIHGDDPEWRAALTRLPKAGRELLWLMPHATFRIALIGPSLTPEIAFGWLFRSHTNGSEGRDLLDQMIRKYRPTSIEEFKRSFLFFRNANQAYEACRSTRAWLFARDKDAAKAKRWLETRGQQIPRDKALITFEGNPAWLKEGFTSCIPDHEKIAYLMAHAVIGDFPVEHSSKGFVLMSALVIERATTP